jgi:peptidoglycan/LPS O-acetylase OafA/YrhL
MAKLASQSPSNRFEALDSLRGVCAILVALFHFHVQSAIYALPIVRHGWMFVDFFFVLSGFVISHAYGRRLSEGTVSFGRFMLLRLGRIYPLHLCVMLLIVGLELARLAFGAGEAFDEQHSAVSFLSNLALLQSMGLHPFPTWNGMSWSIAAEAWAYLLFAVVFVAWPRAALRIFVVLGSIAFLAILRFSDKGLDVTFDLGVFRGLAGFSLGVATRAAYAAGHRIGGSAVEVALLAAAFIMTMFFQSGWTTFLMLPIFSLTVLAFASEEGVISRVLRMRGARFLGKISYSIYLTHGLAQLIAFKAMAKAGALGFVYGAGAKGDEIAAPIVIGDMAVLAMLAMTIAFSTLTYRWIERPAYEWVRALNRRTAPHPASI